MPGIANLGQRYSDGRPISHCSPFCDVDYSLLQSSFLLRLFLRHLVSSILVHVGFTYSPAHLPIPLILAMQSLTPFADTSVCPKRKRLHSSLDNHRSRSTVTIRSQKPGLAKNDTIPSLGFSEAVQSSMAALQTSSVNQKVNDDIILNTEGHKASSKVVDHAVNSKLEVCDPTVAKSNHKFEIPETPQPEPKASPTSLAYHSSPSQVTSALWWEEDEITGHDPTDPTEDGYGINGIGFIPTPAMERARMQLRKRQVAAWKLREAKEARQARSDRRSRDNGLKGQACILGGSSNESKQVKKVRFFEA